MKYQRSRATQKAIRAIVDFRLYCLVGVLWLPGCGSGEYVDVRGQVTLDGEPLANAFLTFLPDPSSTTGTVAYGKTDADGNDILANSNSHAGILPGTFDVEMSPAEEYSDEDGILRRRPERVPAEFNRRTTLTSDDVPPGERQTCEFSLPCERGK